MKLFQLLSKLFTFILVIFLVKTVQAEPLPQPKDTVRIGLMLSDEPETDINSREALFTVQTVADIINEEGGLNGKYLDIIVKSGDGDWGISSKRSVELIFDHEVSAIIGSLDGQNAHLTQMAITKAEVVFLTTRSTDPTLSNANIPWFFRVIPSDIQQAETLIEYIFKERALNNIAVIYSSRYDSRMAANTFNRLVSEMYRYSISTFEYDLNESKISDLLVPLKDDNIQGIVHFGMENELKNILTGMKEAGLNKPVFLPLTSHNDVFEKDYAYEIYSVCPQKWPAHFDTGFINAFKEQFQRNPDLIAAYSYDAIQILVNSIQNNGPGRREIRDHLSEINFPTGVTGQIRFNSNGDILNQSAICKR